MLPSRGRTLRHDAEHQFGVGDVGAADGVAADSLTLLRHGAAHLPEPQMDRQGSAQDRLNREVGTQAVGTSADVLRFHHDVIWCHLNPSDLL